jgi:hypothetical protein
MQEARTEEAGWPRADLFFMKDALDRGMSYAEVAGFLSRTEEEVREQSEVEQASKRRAVGSVVNKRGLAMNRRAARARIARR